MTIKMFSLVLLLLSVFVIPKSLSSNTPSNDVELSLTPLACFVKTIGDVCHLTIKVSWQSASPINACLYQNVEKVHCWSAKSKVTKKIMVSLSESMIFSLKGDNNEIYTQQQVAIAASTSKKYRRRLRADWSLF
ncbi:MAG: DUF3019 domain-containing protein [Colwellia sp.]|nr:DUF3019 domain-containing protein [Colwellia sp.]